MWGKKTEAASLIVGLLAGMLGEALRAFGTCAVLRTVLGLGALRKEGLLDVLEEGRGRW